MSEQVTISREVLETLVEAASGCGSASCWYHDAPLPNARAWRAAVLEALEYAAVALGGVSP